MVAAALPMWWRYAAKLAITPGVMGSDVANMKVEAKTVKAFHLLR